jgi:hypothetical protein
LVAVYYRAIPVGRVPGGIFQAIDKDVLPAVVYVFHICAGEHLDAICVGRGIYGSLYLCEVSAAILFHNPRGGTKAEAKHQAYQ